MGYDDPDVYYQPEKFGLEKVAEIDYSDRSYCFDSRTVWRHKKSGKLYTARDSGCSCPGMFENYTTLESLAPFELSVIEAEVEKERKGKSYEGEDPDHFLKTIRSL